MANQQLWSQISVITGRRLVYEAKTEVDQAKDNFENRQDGTYDWTVEELWGLISDLQKAHYGLMCTIYSYLNGPIGRMMLHMPWTLERKFLKSLREIALNVTEKIPEHAWSYDIEDLQDYRHTLGQLMSATDTLSGDLSGDQVGVIYSRLEMLLAYLDFAPNVMSLDRYRGMKEARDKVYGVTKAMASLIKREAQLNRFSIATPSLPELMLVARLWHSRGQDQDTELMYWCNHFVSRSINCSSQETVKDHIRLAMMIGDKPKVMLAMRTLISMRPRPWAAIAKAKMWLLR